MKPITVIYHSADFDGLFCREIARKFLPPDSKFVGWDFGDPACTPDWPPGQLYILDLPCDAPFGFDFKKLPPKGDTAEMFENVIWIDHHASSIESHPKDIPGYRIDGVSACRLAWQWFNRKPYPGFDKQWCELPCKEYFIDRIVTEPLAVRLAGEYDVWDRRDPQAGLLQYGLRTVKPEQIPWEEMFHPVVITGTAWVIERGKIAQQYAQTVDAANLKAGFLTTWEGLKWLCLNGRGNSQTFVSRDLPETGHDALLMFYFNGSTWVVSLYHAGHNTWPDLCKIAVKYGGGGHKGACGFTTAKLPFLP